MIKKIFRAYILFALLFMVNHPVYAYANTLNTNTQKMVDSDPYSLISAVNQLRAANGLPAYSINQTLMGIAQSHASFMAANGVSHQGVGGSSPYQRAIAAGYPLAGDLTQGGFFSENITAGGNKSVTDAVAEWQGDAPHLNTMLSPTLTEIGAGVVVVNGYNYFVIDCGRSTESGQPQVVPVVIQDQISSIPLKPVVVKTLEPNTPEPDGNTYHIVKEGETLWLIAVSYGIKIDQIKSYNPSIFETNIYPGQKIFIPISLRPTPTDSPATATLTPTQIATILPTNISQLSPTDLPAITNANVPMELNSNKMNSLDIIIFVVISFAAIVLTVVFILTLKKMQD